MGFLGEDLIFLFLRRNDLFVFFRSGQTKKIVFPETVVRNLEVVDKKLFENILREFFSSLPKQRGVLFLSHSVVFDHVEKQDAKINSDDELKRFIDTIPLSTVHVATKVIHTKSHSFFFATNKDLCETILAIAGQNKWQIRYVVPISLFDNFFKGQKLSYNLFFRAVREKYILERGNYLQKEENGEKNKMPFMRYLMLGISSFLLLAALLFTGYNFHFFPFLVRRQPETVKVTLSPTKKPVVFDTPTPVVAESVKLEKEDVRVEVLNGSGIAGQAGMLRGKLEALGFKNIEIGDVEGYQSNATIVIFSEGVSQDLQDEILIALKDIFDNVEVQQLPKTGDFDVSITTGDIK